MGRTKKYTQKSILENNQIINSMDTKVPFCDEKINMECYQENYNVFDISNFKKKEKMLYDVLNDFYIKCSEEEIKRIIQVINGKYNISLRFLDWFVTRYCYLYKTSIEISNIYNVEQDFNINISYKAQLKSFKKKNFDPFKRKNKFYYSFNKNTIDYTILTTLGQLNFFKWVLSYDIIKYVEKNFVKINNKINYVNSFFKKNIIDNTSLSIVSSNDLNSNSSDSLGIKSSHSTNKKIIYESVTNSKNNSCSKSFKKKSQSYNPIVSRNIFVEL